MSMNIGQGVQANGAGHKTSRSSLPGHSHGAATVFFALILSTAVVVYLLWGPGVFGILNQPKQRSDWQAAFLTNGQVYFGQVSDERSDPVVIRDIYYLQITQPLQQAVEGQAIPQQPELSLVKLGNELHGPFDEMRINRDHILFIEDLKNEGKVVEAIKNHKASGQ